MSKLYKIKHVPTGLYFCPSRKLKVLLTTLTNHREITLMVKSNLSKTGKVYAKKPSIKLIGSKIYTHYVSSENELRNGCKVITVSPTDWIIEEIVPNMVE